jgi:hypothetical protein
MNEQLSLEEYKQKVRECLINIQNCTVAQTNELVEAYVQILPEYYGLKLSPEEMACAMVMGY